MLEQLLERNESKTLEFKERITSSSNIIRSIVAFANTAGGTLIVGVEDKSKRVVGVEHVLDEEERLANIIAEAIEPMLIPDIEIMSYQNREVIVINVPYLVGPYYYKKLGLEKGTYIRLASTNRLADRETIANLQRLSKNDSFDEIPCKEAKKTDLDHEQIQKVLHAAFKNLNEKSYLSLGLLIKKKSKTYPTYGGLLLFSNNRLEWLPDTTIKCVCFAGTTRDKIIDQKNISSSLTSAVDEIITFILRHTNLSANIGTSRRIDIPQFPQEAIREAVINAIVHTDYAMTGSSIQISVFGDRIVIANPGGLPFGQTIESAMSGISRMRNRVIGRIFRECKLIETLGTGLLRITKAYEGTRANPPIIEEINNHFRVTLFEIPVIQQPVKAWEKLLLNALTNEKKLSTNQIAKLWGVGDRAARKRLKLMLEKGLVIREGSSENDPKASYGAYG